MRFIFGLVLLLGVALAGGAVFLAKDQISQYKAAVANAEAAQARQIPTKPIYVTNRALKYGERLSPQDVRLVEFPVNAIPEGAYLSPETLFPTNTDKLRVVLRQIEKDEAVLAVKVTDPGQDAGITSRLERGMRAFAIRVDVSSGVSGFLRPGDRVDVYWTGRVNITNVPSRTEVTKLIEAGVSLIAVDQSADGDRGETSIARTVTVAVDPKQVASLAQAQSTGRLSLSLVGAGDDTIANAVEVDQRSLLGIAAEEIRVEAVQEKVCTIRTRRGAEVLEIPIPCTN